MGQRDVGVQVEEEECEVVTVAWVLPCRPRDALER